MVCKALPLLPFPMFPPRPQDHLLPSPISLSQCKVGYFEHAADLPQISSLPYQILSIPTRWASCLL
jgi:hypothetical protein